MQYSIEISHRFPSQLKARAKAPTGKAARPAHLASLELRPGAGEFASVVHPGHGRLVPPQAIDALRNPCRSKRLATHVSCSSLRLPRPGDLLTGSWDRSVDARAAAMKLPVREIMTPIDYQREDFTRVLPGGFAIVFDGIGEEGYRRSFVALKRGGLLCAYGYSAGVQAQRRMLTPC